MKTGRVIKGVLGALLLFVGIVFIHAKFSSARSATTDTVNWNTTYQTMDGFGGQTWTYADNLSGSNADLFFSQTAGIGLTIVRSANTWNGSIPDLVTLQSALARGVKVELGLQSPPCNLKHSYVDLGEDCDNGSSDGTSAASAFSDGAAGSNGNCFTNTLSLDGSGGAYQQYAKYIVNTISTYQNSPNNVPIAYLDVQNEPDLSAGNVHGTLGTCIWRSGAQFEDFIHNYLGPALSAAGLHPAVMLGSSPQWFYPDYTTACLSNSSCARYVAIAAGHGYSTNASAYPLGTTGGRHVWMSEFSDGGTWDTSMTSALEVAQSMHSYLTTANASAYEWWQLAYNPLDGNHGLTDQFYNTTKRFYATGNWSKFVRPGWVRIDTNGNPAYGVLVTAFKNPSTGNFAIVAINTNGSASSMNFPMNGFTANTVTPWITSASYNLVPQSSITAGNSFSYNLPAQSVTTFVGTNGGGGGDTTPPSTPTTFSATAVSRSQINLSWTASTDNVGVAGYKVFRNGSQIATTFTNSYSDVGLNSNTSYSYAVSAYDAAGNNSTQSTGARATTQSGSLGGGISLIQTGNNIYQENATLHSNIRATFTSAVKTGDAIVVALGFGGTHDVVSGCTDSLHNTFAEAGHSINTKETVGTDVWYAANITGGTDAVTCTFSAPTAYDDIALQEYSGIASSDPVDVTASNDTESAVSTSWTTGSVTTHASEELLFAVFQGNEGLNTLTPTDGFAKAVDNGSTANFTTMDTVQTSAGSIAATASSPAADQQSNVVVAFKAGSSGGSVTGHLQ